MPYQITTSPRLTGPLPPHPSHPSAHWTTAPSSLTPSAHQTPPPPPRSLGSPDLSPLMPPRVTRPLPPDQRPLPPSPSHPLVSLDHCPPHPSHPLGSPGVCAVICCPSVKSVRWLSSRSHSCTRRVRVLLVASTLGWTELNRDRKFTYTRRRDLAAGSRGEGRGR